MVASFPDDLALTRDPGTVCLVFIPGDDRRMTRVEDLCYRALHEPFGVTRQPDWDNMDPASTHLVATIGDQVVGYARLIVEGDWGHIRQVVVEPEFRRHGVARALVVELVALASRMQLTRVYLNSRMPAVALYESVGFRVVSKDPFPMPRTYVPHVRMEMRLGG